MGERGRGKAGSGWERGGRNGEGECVRGLEAGMRPARPRNRHRGAVSDARRHAAACLPRPPLPPNTTHAPPLHPRHPQPLTRARRQRVLPGHLHPRVRPRVGEHAHGTGCRERRSGCGGGVGGGGGRGGCRRAREKRRTIGGEGVRIRGGMWRVLRAARAPRRRGTRPATLPATPCATRTEQQRGARHGAGARRRGAARGRRGLRGALLVGRGAGSAGRGRRGGPAGALLARGELKVSVVGRPSPRGR
jgi:hypothetical protein